MEVSRITTPDPNQAHRDETADLSWIVPSVSSQVVGGPSEAAEFLETLDSSP